MIDCYWANVNIPDVFSTKSKIYFSFLNAFASLSENIYPTKTCNKFSLFVFFSKNSLYLGQDIRKPVLP